MINNELTLLGVGSIGKNLLNSVIKKNIFTRINIFDDDKVEKHNIVYNKKFIGEDKVFACQKQFGNIITPIKKFIYDDNITKHDKEIFNKSKYIIDCRDMHENRKRFSAIKLFISNNKLIADFRKK
jgi:predicted ThiF/HesA family dinucleotide-utilizing enzyme